MKQLIFPLFFLLITACTGQAQSEEAKNNSVRRVTKEFFKEELKDSSALILDVRTKGEFDQGAIEGAVNIDFFSDGFSEKISQLPRDKKVLLYCQSGGRSGKTLKKMKEMGFEEVYELEGGFGGW